MDFEDLVRSSLDLAVDELITPDPQAQPDPGDHQPLVMAAVVGFAGDNVRGTLGVAANLAGHERVAGLFNMSLDDPTADEALGELANLLLGHIKRTWGKRNIHVSLATPLLVRGLAIEVQGRRDGLWIERSVEDGSSVLTAWFDAQPSPDLVVGEESADDETADQGEALFF